MGIKGILFDKDGTLIDFFKVWEPAIAPVTERILQGCDLKPQKALIEKVMTCLGYTDGKIDPEGAIAWKSYRGIAADLKQCLLEVFRRVSEDMLAHRLEREFYREVSEKRNVYPGFTDLPALFERLQKNGIHIGLATTDDRRSTKHCMACMDVDGYISFWGTADGSLPQKPDRALLYAAAAKWKIRPEEVAVVGDTPNDMRFAANAGAVGIAVLSGTGDCKRLEPLADYVIGSVDDLWELLCKLQKENEISYDRLAM